MGLGRLLMRPSQQSSQGETRTITEFATIDGRSMHGESANLQSYRGGMSLPGAWRAALLIADVLASVPWNAWRERDGVVEQVSPRPWILEQPAGEHTRMTTLRSWVLDLVWHGNAFGIVATRNRDGWPTSVLPVSATRVQVRNARVPQGATGKPGVGVEYVVNGSAVPTRDVFHAMGPSAPGELRGFGVLEAHVRGVLELGHEQMRQTHSMSQHGVPTGVLEVSDPDSSQEDLQAVKDSWLRSQRDRSIAVLNSTTEFKPLSWNPDELQLVDARRYTLHEIALIFGLPLSFLGADQASRTYSNIEQEGLNLLKYSLAGHLAQLEQTLSLHLPRGMWAQANLDSVLRADTATRYQAHQTGISAGFLTVNEAREAEYLPPLPEQDDEGQDDETPSVGDEDDTGEVQSWPVDPEKDEDDDRE